MFVWGIILSKDRDVIQTFSFNEDFSETQIFKSFFIFLDDVYTIISFHGFVAFSLFSKDFTLFFLSFQECLIIKTHTATLHSVIAHIWPWICSFLQYTSKYDNNNNNKKNAVKGKDSCFCVVGCQFESFYCWMIKCDMFYLIFSYIYSITEYFSNSLDQNPTQRDHCWL